MIPTRRALLAGAGAAAVLPTVAAPAGAAAAPDAGLIRLCAEHIANRATYNTLRRLPGIGGRPAVARLRAHPDAVCDAKPQTIAGMVAIARVAKVEATRSDGTEEPENGVSADLAWNLVNDLLRLHGEAAA